jgi:hypothetical protein
MNSATCERPGWRSGFVAMALLASLLLAGCATASKQARTVECWGRAEITLASRQSYANPLQDQHLTATFTAPDGRELKVDGFWDGGTTWRVRFMPDELGQWIWRTESGDKGLHARQGRFVCIPATGKDRFSQHGPVRVSTNRRHLEHADGTPFFWLADTCWNGALLATPEEWSFYIGERTRQQFTAVQWVATQWRAAPEGDLLKRRAFTGSEQIAVNVEFFQQLDAKADALNRAGLLNVPVLLWAIGGGSDPKVNPGFALPEDQAVKLARYMVARWQANHVVWFLPGDGDYRGEKAERWKRIGRAVFGGGPHAPVSLHPGGMHWNWNDFKDEPWLDLIGYQSGHGDDDRTLQWINTGPPAADWRKEPHRPFINLEPPYENHIAYQSKRPHDAHSVRRAMYWSLLNAPTAGVSYGGHGVWGWDDGTKPPTDHKNSGIPLPWQKALLMPAAEQMAHLAGFFTSLPFHTLRPAPELLVKQPGSTSPKHWIAASRSEDGRVIVAYTPVQQAIEIRQRDLPRGFQMQWFNPRDGKRLAVIGVVNGDNLLLTPPGEGDWVLVVTVKPG